MPTYTYLCDNCKERFEEFHKIDRRYDVQCPLCDSPKIQIIIASPIVISSGADSKHVVENPPANYLPLSGFQGITMTNCSAIGCKTGLKIGRGADVNVNGFTSIDNETGIDINE